MGRVVKHVKSALDQSSNKKVKEKNIKYKRNQGKRRCCDMICYFGKEIKKINKKTNILRLRMMSRVERLQSWRGLTTDKLLWHLSHI